jgi:hypothetical protein
VIRTEAMPQRSKQPTVFRLIRLNYYYISSLTRGIQNLFWQESKREQKPIPRAKFGKEAIAEYTGGQNRSYIIVLRRAQACLGFASALFRLCSGMLTLGLYILTLGLG